MAKIQNSHWYKKSQGQVLKLRRKRSKSFSLYPFLAPVFILAIGLFAICQSARDVSRASGQLMEQHYAPADEYLGF